MKPLFIIGMPRSGTKLLREILNQHVDLSIPKAESVFLPYFYARWSKKEFLTKKDYNKFYKEFVNSSFYYHIDNSQKIWEKGILYKNLNNKTIVDLIESIFRLHAKYENKKYWGDKTPEYIYCTKMIKAMFPDARFIHIIRDVRDYCLSVRKAWDKNVYRAAQKWVEGIEQVRRENNSFINDYYEIKYEELIDNPSQEIEKLCNWLGLEFSRKMVNFTHKVEFYGDAKDTTGILEQNYKKWTKSFNKSEISKIESIAGKTLLKLGYETSHTVYTPIKKIEGAYFAICDIYNLFIFRCKEYKSIFQAAKRLFRDFKNKLGFILVKQ